MGPDEFFTAAQCDRLSQLMTQLRYALAAGDPLPSVEQAELEELVRAEVAASARRAAAQAQPEPGPVATE